MFNHLHDWYLQRKFLNACQKGNLQQVITLLATHPKDKIKNTALIKAAYHGQDKIVLALLNANANHSVKDEQHFTALAWAAYQGQQDAVQILLANGADPDLPTRNNETALMWAVRANHTDTIQCFIDAQVNLETKDKRGFTALTHAAYKGNEEVVSLLLEAGANPNATARQNTTVLMWAAHAGHTEVMQLLLNAGADPNLPNDDGETPLMWATTQKRGRGPMARQGSGTALTQSTGGSGNVGGMGGDFLRPGAVHLLIDAGVDIHAKDHAGETALSKAIQARHKEIIKLLEESGAQT